MSDHAHQQTAWKHYKNQKNTPLESFVTDYASFLDQNKQERECIQSAVTLLEKAGYRQGRDLTNLKAGDRVYYIHQAKNLFAMHIGSQTLEKGFHLIASHIDSPRLDLKPHPLLEKEGFALWATHYYGGVKKYQWLNIPLALCGVVCLQDGRRIDVRIGYHKDEPRFLIPDLLPHLDAKTTRERTSENLIHGEEMMAIAGSTPCDDQSHNSKENLRQRVLNLLKERYQILEEDFLSAELELVPALESSWIGLDKELLASYGHDDRVCAYTSLRALIESTTQAHSQICFWADKEEIGSTGSTGMQSTFIAFALEDILRKLNSPLSLLQVFERSYALSADVSAAVNPIFPNVHDKNNVARLHDGLVLLKYSGHKGKVGASDANAEYLAWIRQIFHEKKVPFQSGLLGRVDEGGGGTVAKYLAFWGMQVLDAGPAVLSMHAPYEIVSKADVYSAFQAYQSFYEAKSPSLYTNTTR